MKTKFIEAQSKMNWGKFMVCRFSKEELARPSAHMASMPISLLRQIGWDDNQVVVFDLQTCEGAGFRIGGCASADLQKHGIWVCPMYEPFLEWLYTQDLSDLDKLPSMVTIPQEIAHKHESMAGYRRQGPIEALRKELEGVRKERDAAIKAYKKATGFQVTKGTSEHSSKD